MVRDVNRELQATTLLERRLSRILGAMEVHFAPDLRAKIDQLVSETGRAPDKLADAMAGYVAELAETREMLNGPLRRPEKRQAKAHGRRGILREPSQT